MMAGQPLRISSSGKTRVSKTLDVGSIPTIRANISWTAILSAALLICGLLVGAVALFYRQHETLGFAGLLELAGVGWAVLSLRDGS